MVIAPAILLASTLMVGDLEWPSTRRLILPASRRSRATASAYVGEGIVDLEIVRPAANISAALNGQLGRIIERFEVIQDDVDIYKARLFTRVKYPAVRVLPIRKNQLFVDITVNPEALTPTEAITPPVIILKMERDGFPLPVRQYQASSEEGQRILRALDRGYVHDARVLALNESPHFLSEVLTEIIAKKTISERAPQPKINVEQLPLPATISGKLMWTVAAISVGLFAEADEVLRDLRKLNDKSIRPYIDLYQIEIERRLGRKKVTVAQLKKIVRDGRDLPQHFASRAIMMGVRVALAREDLNEALALLKIIDDPESRLWRAELNYMLGRKGQALALYKKAAQNVSTKLRAELRLVDLGGYATKEDAEAALFRLNDRAENEVVSMLARARLLERGILTKSFKNTLISLAHLAASNIRPVAMDAELRIGRLNARAGRPTESFQAFLRSETHAQESVSRSRLRVRTFAGMSAAVDQLIRWRREKQLVMFANDFDELIPSHPDAAKLMLDIAIAARHVGNTDLAIDYLVKIAKRNDVKNDDVVLAELISTYLQNGDIPRARTIVAYADESKRTLRSTPLHRAKAELLNRTGHPKEAIKHFMRAAQLGKTVGERSDDLARAADIALDHDLFSTAKKALLQMLFRERLSTQRKTNVRIDLATVYIKEGKPKDAVKLLHRVRTSSVANRTPEALVAQASYFEGEALFRMGEYKSARDIWLSRRRGTTHWDEFCRSAAQAADVAAKLEKEVQ